MVAKPSRSNSYCCMCKLPFDDYLTVLSHSHSTSPFPVTKPSCKPPPSPKISPLSAQSFNSITLMPPLHPWARTKPPVK